MAFALGAGVRVARAQAAAPDSVRPMSQASVPDISGLETASRIGDVLFWIGQARYVVFASNPSTGGLKVFAALYGVQEAGLGLDFYANQALLRTYRGMGGEASFLRTSARTLYLADKAIAIGSAGLLAYGMAEDQSDLAIVGGLGFAATNLFDIYVWHQLSQSNGEARSAIRNWNAGVGLRGRGLDLVITYSFM